LLALLPNLSEILHSLQSENSLLLCELSILTQGVKTNDKLSHLLQEGLLLDDRPSAFLGDIDLAILFLFIANPFRLFVPLLLGFLKII